jgi:predicted AlkP superfamily phosphohydrolase/phosphomutase
MKVRHQPHLVLLSFLVLVALIIPGQLTGQTPPKAMVLAWDGAVPSFVQEMLRQGKLPNLAKLIHGGAFADDVTSVFPSFTAPAFASLWSGAPPKITGITGNRVPRLPRSRFTILESVQAFNTARLGAEPLWAVAVNAGRRVVVVHVPFSGQSSARGVHIHGYAGIAGRDGALSGRSTKPQPATNWENVPASEAPPLEIRFTIAGSNLFGIFIDDPADPQNGYDTLLIASTRDGKNIRAKLKSAPANPAGERLWSEPLAVNVSGGRSATIYLRLFDLKLDGSDFLLYFTRPAREVISHPELVKNASATSRSFIGNGAAQLYSARAFGSTIADGGDGIAEARYLETVTHAQRQLVETVRWALEHLPWDLFAVYTPFPDEAEHLWRGYLEPTLSGFRQELAERLRSYLELVYQTSDDLLGMMLAHRPENTLVALVSDHGMEGIDKLVAINKALQESGLLVLDQGRVDLAKTKAIYPNGNTGCVLINTTDRKQGIVTRAERDEVARRIREAFARIRDGDRQPVSGIFDVEIDGAAMGIGGDSAGDLCLDLLPGYDFDSRLHSADVIMNREPHGMHGFNPQRHSMRTIMVLNGPGVAPGRKLRNVRIIDFAPTLSKLLGIPPPKDATGKVLEEALSDSR